MALFVPALIGTGLFLAFMLGSRDSAAEDKAAQDELDKMSPKEKEAVKESAKAVKEEDWLKAVSEALKSNSPMLMREVAARMKKAGLKSDAEELLKLADKLESSQKTAAGEAEKKPAPSLSKPAPVESKPAATKVDTSKKSTTTSATKITEKPSTSDAKKKAEAEAKKKAEAEAKKKAEAEAKKKAEAEAKKKAEAEAKKKAEAEAKLKQAKELKAHLQTTTRYKENRSLVAAFQKTNGLLNDGMYGHNTARVFWSKYKLVPVNPFYWTASTANKDTAAYRAFLDTIAVDAPKHQAEVTKLKATVGK